MFLKVRVVLDLLLCGGSLAKKEMGILSPFEIRSTVEKGISRPLSIWLNKVPYLTPEISQPFFRLTPAILQADLMQLPNI